MKKPFQLEDINHKNVEINSASIHAVFNTEALWDCSSCTERKKHSKTEF